MLIMVQYNLSDFSEKVQCHWKVFIAKEFIVPIEFVKAKEMVSKEIYCSLISTHFVDFSIPGY